MCSHFTPSRPTARNLFWAGVYLELKKSVLSVPNMYKPKWDKYPKPANINIYLYFSINLTRATAGRVHYQNNKLKFLGSSDNESGSDNDDLEPDTYYDNIEINEDDEHALQMFMSSKPQKTRTLADIIMDKITEKHTELHTQFSDVETLKLQDLDPR